MLNFLNTWRERRNASGHGLVAAGLQRLLSPPLDVNDFAELCFTDTAGGLLRQARVHGDLQAFLDRHRLALIELPRDHGKSVQICIRILWELGRDPSLRVKIVCASDAVAAERCRFLRNAIAQNECVRLAFPELRPGRPWGATRFTIRRPADVIGPSVTAIGVGSVSTGSRADILVCDDIVDVKALRSRADRERVKAFFHENLMNLLEPDGRFWGLFTPWHKDDLNSDLKQNPAYALFRRAVEPESGEQRAESLEQTGEGQTGPGSPRSTLRSPLDDWQPVWPEKWPAERLAARRREIGAAAFARAYRLVCVPDDEVPIKAAWVQFWESRELRAESTEPRAKTAEQGAGAGSLLSTLRSPLYEEIILSVDPAVSTKTTADQTALVTLGRTENNEIHCLESCARRVSAPDLVNLIDDADRRWQPDVILFESNAAFAGIKDLLMRHARFGTKIKPVVQTRDKMSRVHAFSVGVENGSFRLRGADPTHVHPGQQALFDEVTTFPFGEHDDLLDAAATGTAYLLDRPEPRVW